MKKFRQESLEAELHTQLGYDKYGKKDILGTYIDGNESVKLYLFILNI